MVDNPEDAPTTDNETAMEFLRHLIGHKMVDLHMDESTGMLVIVTDYYDEDGQVALFCENVVYAVRAKPLIQ